MNWQLTDILVVIGAVVVGVLIIKYAQAIVKAIVKALTVAGIVVGLAVLALVLAWYFDLLPDVGAGDVLTLLGGMIQ
jgi:multisubunit Na+/H+ antiporter MnhC subunit